MTEHPIDLDALEDWDEEPVCEHPEAAVISDVDGAHFCAGCNTEWWEDPL